MTRARDVANITDLPNAKGDIYTATADNTPAVVTVGANNTLLVADSAQSSGVKWSSTLSGLTLTSPTISTITNTGTITLPTTTDTLVGKATSDVLSNKILLSPEERTTVSATAANTTVTFDAVTQGVLYYTTNASANWTINIRGNSSTTLSSLMAVGDAITVVFMVTQGGTAYYATGFQIDGNAVTPKWQGGTAPSSGNTSAVDVYVYTIIKTAATPTYTVFASQTKFA